MESPEESYSREQHEEESGKKKKEMALGEGGGDDESGEGGKEDPKNSSSSLMLGLLDEFTKIYSDRLQRVEETAMKCDEKQYWENKVCVLESWVRDLGEQNAVLVVTVEELEREAADRVALLEDRLNKMAATTRESCVSLRDHQIQVSSLVTDKIGLEKKAQGLGEKVLGLERKNVCLKEENSNLQSDLNNLVQVITRARQTGQWEADDLTFSCVTPEQVFGPVLSSSRRSSQSLKESQRDYLHQLLEDQLRKDNSSLASSFSNLQDADSSMYGGRSSEKDLIIMKLRSEFRNLQSSHEETNRQLLERDKQIADLQTQLTETHHELAHSQAEVNSVNHTLQELRHRNRHESVEITRKEEVIRHLLSKQSFLKKDSVKGSSPSLCDLDTVITGENNVEAQLSENIDVLASRLAELEDECQQLRDQHTQLQDTHALCAPTINMLQEQLNRSHQTQVELRTVLTAEVAQRHDELVTLRDELKEKEQKHHETQMQLQLKTQVIKDLRKEIRDIRDRRMTDDDKNALTPMKDGVYRDSKETKSAEMQTSEIFSNKNISLTEETSRGSTNGFCSPASLSSQISKLENELAEKSVLLRELQSHLAASRQELHLKDETLHKLEQKLDSSRREGGQKGERMQYLTGQLTSLQLEVGRTHGQAEQFRRQTEKKTELIEKMQAENSSLTQQLNEKSSTLERFQAEILKISTDLEKKKKEVAEQRMTIRTLQEALVSSKRSCDELRSRLDNDGFELCADICKLQYKLVESGARAEVLREENRALSRRVTALQDDLKHAHKNDTRHAHYWKTQAEEAAHKLTQTRKETRVGDARQSEKASREKEHLQRQAQEAERRRQEVLTSLHLLQGQVQTLEEEVTAAAEARAEAERRAEDAQRNNLQLQERLSLHETSESVERLGQQLEEAVAALTAAREEARNKGEQLRRAQQDVDQLSDALGYEKDLNTTLQDQVEGLMKEVTTQENKVGELQQEIRRLTRDSLQKERQVATLQSQLEGLKSQVATMEELLDEEQREVVSLTDSLTQETKTLQETRTKCDRVSHYAGASRRSNARKEAARADEQVSTLKRELQEAKDKISRQERRAREMESEREADVAAVAERLTAAHEESVRRLEDTLLTYTRMQAHEEYQVESLEESVKELGARLAESELRMKEAQKERDALGRSLQEERSRRENDSHEHQRQVLRLTEETSLLKARLEGVQEESQTWQQQCEDLEERHCHNNNNFNNHNHNNNHNLHAQLAKALQQVESLKEAMTSTKLEKRAAEEERGHAHEQVLSLIRECNALEEQIHRLTKEKCRLQEQLSTQEEELTKSRDDTQNAKDQLALKTERVVALEQQVKLAKQTNEERVQEEVRVLGEEARCLRTQLKEAQEEVRRLKVQGDAHDERGGRSTEAGTEEVALNQTTTARSEVTTARREATQARRALLERDTHARVTHLKLTTLERTLQDRHNEVTTLEERLQETHSDNHRLETEATQLRAQVAMLTAQLSHAHAHKHTNAHAHPDANRVEALEDEVSRLKGELAAAEEQLKQACSRESRVTQELQQEVATLTRARDDAVRKVMSVEASLGESQETVEATKVLERLWEAQLATVEEEMARLLCETNQLKDCNAALHDQLSGRESEVEALRGQVRAREVQVEEVQQARDLLANDAQVVVAAVKQWLHEQKSANSKLAGKLHQQNKQILLLNTEKQFLAERNTSLQRNNHDLSLQVHDLRTRLGLPPASTPPEKLGKVGGVMVGGLASPRLAASPTFGVSQTAGVSSRVSLDSVLGLPVPLDTKYEDVLSTCSSDGSSSGCLVPGPDLPGAAHLERLAHLADSLLVASRNISRASGLIPYHGYEKITSATSLGDLTSGTTFGHMRSTLALSKATSSSVGNLTSLCPDRRDKATSPISRMNCRVGEFGALLSPGSKVKSRGSEAILAAPVKERRSSHRLFNSDSIEEAEEEEVTTVRSCSRISASQGSSSTLKDSSSTSQGSSRTSPASSTLQGSPTTLRESPGVL